MADVKKINGYDVKDSYSREQIQTLASKLLFNASVKDVTVSIDGLGTTNQVVGLYFKAIDSNNHSLLLQMQQAGQLNFFETTDGGYHWNLLWSK